MGRPLFLLRNYLAGLPPAVALFSTTGEWENDAGIWALAIALCLVGVTLRAWASCHCGYAQDRKMALAGTGPYAYVRNPLYLGNIAIIAGATIASEVLWLLPVSLAWSIVVYRAVATFEEGRLLARYGEEYARYRARVPAWWPSFRWPGSAQEHTPPPFARAMLAQSIRLLWLLPFVLKELNVFGLGSG